MNHLLADPNLNNYIGSLGLTYDIIGIGILFKYQIDANREIWPGPEKVLLLAQESSDQSEIDCRNLRFQNYVKWTETGQILIALGFLCPLAAIWI